MFNDLYKMKSFSLDIPVLIETIAKLEISIKNIEKIGTDVENIGDKLICESWEGNATNIFKEHQQDWKKGYDDMLNQLIDFKESLEKVVRTGAEEINELALALPVPLGGSQGAGYRDIISMEQEGIEELKAKCKTLVYEDYEEQREIMGTIENLSSKLNYSFSIGVAATKNKKTIEENQGKLQAFKGKLQNYEDRVLLFEEEVVDEMSKYAVIGGHKLDSVSFREVLKYQKDDNWKALLSKNVEELSDIEKLVLKAEYESGIAYKIKTFLMKQLGIEGLTYEKLKAMSSENLINKLRENFIGAVEILKKCKIVDSHLTWKSAVDLTFLILPIPSEETISEVKSSIYSKVKHFIEKDRRNDVRLGIVSAMNEDLLSSFATDKAFVFTAFGVDSEVVNEMYRNDYRGIDDWIEPLESKATHIDSFYLGRMLGNAASIAIAIKQGIDGFKMIGGGLEIGIGGTVATEGFGAPVAIPAGVGVASAGIALEGHAIDAGALAFSNFGDNYNDYVKYSNAGTSNAATAIRNVGDDVLDVMESAGGHTLERHVSKTNQDLIKRAIQENVEAATSFTDKSTAIKAVQENLRKNSDDIADWLSNSDSARKTFKVTNSSPIGKGVKADKKSVIYDLTESKMVLVKDETQELGFRIITAFPVVD